MSKSGKKKERVVNSMTGFGSVTGSADGVRWTVEVRSVNARGLDVRLRIPEGRQGLEKDIRGQISRHLVRGSVNVSIRMARDEQMADLGVDPDRVRAALDAVALVETIAHDRGQALETMTAGDVLAIRGVMEPGRDGETDEAITAPILESFSNALDGLIAMRCDEGRAISGVIGCLIDQVETLTSQAEIAAGERSKRTRAAIKSALDAITDTRDGLDEGRLEAELAMIAVKSDVTEELDRLRAHITAARSLLGAGGAIGRKLDFLTQEFNREANTLCSKAGAADLTRIGLDLKAVIDQMREQVQNVE
jgi:uncharacterized protein (TIGR00255 family)